MKKSLTYILLVLSFKCHSQKGKTFFDIKEMNGIWYCLTDTTQYYLFKNGTSVGLSFNPNGNIYSEKTYNPYFFLGLDEYHFLSSSDSTILEIYRIQSEDLFSWKGILGELSLDNKGEFIEYIELIDMNIFSYTKVKNLPNNYYKGFLFQSQIDNINYIEEFLGKNVKLINIKTFIFSHPEIKTNMYLLKNDPVEIVEEKDGWLKIKYYPEKDGQWTGETIEGWIRKEDVE